jgi:hypothetical protein
MGWRALSTSSPHPAPANASWLTLHNLRSQGNGNACHGTKDVGGGHMNDTWAAAACRTLPALEPGWAAELATKKSTEDRS